MVVINMSDAVMNNLNNKYHNPQFSIKHHFPKSLKLQWHITDRCNLRCKHCYQENFRGKELPLKQLEEILNQFKNLLDLWKSQIGRSIQGHISVTGGEPFVRSDLFNLLQLLADNKEILTFSVMTNGSYINPQISKLLKELNPRSVQVSIEGMKKTHDNIRGKGSFDQATEALKYLTKEGIKTYISFTAHKGNYTEFPYVAQLGRELKVSRIWSERLVPFGNGAKIKDQLLSIEETQKFFQLMRQSQKEMTGNSIWNKLIFKRLRRHSRVSMNRSLQFLISRGFPHHCTAADSLITVLPNGDLVPCRRMPIKVGNLIDTSLNEIYNGNSLFQKLRDPNQIPSGCSNCLYRKYCRGGLKCLSFALTGNPFTSDPGCWLASSNKTLLKSAYKKKLIDLLVL
jgi:radical SAM protein with 4Fe4S-binding SPASM domain